MIGRIEAIRPDGGFLRRVDRMSWCGRPAYGPGHACLRQAEVILARRWMSVAGHPRDSRFRAPGFSGTLLKGASTNDAFLLPATEAWRTATNQTRFWDTRGDQQWRRRSFLRGGLQAHPARSARTTKPSTPLERPPPWLPRVRHDPCVTAASSADWWSPCALVLGDHPAAPRRVRQPLVEESAEARLGS